VTATRSTWASCVRAAALVGVAAAAARAGDGPPRAPVPAAPPPVEEIRPRPAPDTSGDFWHVVFDVEAGDFGGDGRADLAVSSPDAGHILLFAGPIERSGPPSPAPTAVIECGRGGGLSGNNSALAAVRLFEGDRGAALLVGNSDEREARVWREPLKDAAARRAPLGRDDAAHVLASREFAAGSAVAATPRGGAGREPEIAIAGATKAASRVFFASAAALPKKLDLDAASSRVLGQRGTRVLCENVGWDIAYADFDGDRVAELVVSSPRAPGRNGDNTAGRIDVLGRTGPTSALEQRATLFGKGPRNRFGREFAILDFDRDGKPDLATCSSHAKRVLAPPSDGKPAPVARNVGEVYLVPNRLLRDGAVAASDDPAIQLLHGKEHDERFGWTIVAGDFDGDGGDDLLVAGKFASANGGKDVARGQVYVVPNATLRSPRPWEEKRRDALVVLAPDGVRHFGSCGVAADFDGDGCTDAAIGGIAFAPDVTSPEEPGAAPVGRLAILYGSRKLFAPGETPVLRTLR